LASHDRFLRPYAIGSTLLLGILALGAFARPTETLRVRELTVERINVVDTTGRVRVEIAGSFPPRRVDLAGLLFVNHDGGEAGGLVYRGAAVSGRVAAGGSLTMDQYQEDQVVALQYGQDGDHRTSGLTITDRPTRMGPELAELYRVLDPMPEGPARDSVKRVLLARVPLSQRAARRVFVGRDTSNAAMLELKDRAGVARLRLAVDSLGVATVAFLDSTGRVVRRITQ
jgi:hypothetical protein